MNYIILQIFSQSSTPMKRQPHTVRSGRVGGRGGITLSLYIINVMLQERYL